MKFFSYALLGMFLLIAGCGQISPSDADTVTGLCDYPYEDTLQVGCCSIKGEIVGFELFGSHASSCPMTRELVAQNPIYAEILVSDLSAIYKENLEVWLIGECWTDSKSSLCGKVEDNNRKIIERMSKALSQDFAPILSLSAYSEQYFSVAMTYDFGINPADPRYIETANECNAFGDILILDAIFFKFSNTNENSFKLWSKECSYSENEEYMHDLVIDPPTIIDFIRKDELLLSYHYSHDSTVIGATYLLQKYFRDVLVVLLYADEDSLNKITLQSAITEMNKAKLAGNSTQYSKESNLFGLTDEDYFGAVRELWNLDKPTRRGQIFYGQGNLDSFLENELEASGLEMSTLDLAVRYLKESVGK